MANRNSSAVPNSHQQRTVIANRNGSTPAKQRRPARARTPSAQGLPVLACECERCEVSECVSSDGGVTEETTEEAELKTSTPHRDVGK